MSERLAFVELDERGLDYVREHLSGVNLFCTALSEVLLGTEGVVFTLAPFGIEPERLHRFSAGGLLGLEHGGNIVRLPMSASIPASLKIEQSAYLISLLREHAESICIVDDFDPSWAQTQMHDDDPHLFGVEDEVYHLLTDADPPDNFVRALVSGETSWHGVAAICAQGPEIDEDRIATAESLHAIAGSVLAFTCTAYDGESFIAWSRKSATR